MRRFQIKALKHLPYQMASLYFILFIISITVSVITTNCGDEVFKKYTSCHGNKVHNINWIGVFIVIQMALLFVSIEPDQSKGSKVMSNKNEEDINYSSSDDAGVYSRVFPGSDYTIKIEDKSVKNRNLYKKINAKDETMSEPKERKDASATLMEENGIYFVPNEINELQRNNKSEKELYMEQNSNRNESHLKYGEQNKNFQKSTKYKDYNKKYRLNRESPVDQNLRIDLSESIITTKIIKAKEVIRKRVRICWSSIWMISYNFVIFMGVHGSLLASRIHAHISLNKYGIETCHHLSYFPLSLTSPRLKDPILSESVFLVTYLSFTIHEIVIRKTENCFLIKNFFGKHYFKESKLLGSVRLIIQIILFSANIALIIVCIMCGFGSPMHVLVGFSISMLALWINALLSQLLELTHYGEMKAPTLEYSYIWSILSAFLLWFCGFFYYVSVYGVPYKRVYFYLHPLAWLILISLTYYKRREIFNSSQYLQGFVPTFT